jgi:hypothetical protein
MISPIAIATRGRLSLSSKKTLTLSTVGRIVIVTIPPIVVPPTTNIKEPTYNSYGGGFGNLKYEDSEDNSWIILEDNVIIAIVKLTLKTVII